MSNDLLAAILDQDGPTLSILTESGPNLRRLVAALRGAGFDVVEWRATRSKFAAEDLMMALITGWQLRDVHAANWNAVAEGLHVRGLSGPERVALVISDAHLFKESDPIQWRAGIRTLSDIAQEWHELGGMLRVISDLHQV